MRFVLTGSSGMLGFVLAEELIARGHVRLEPDGGTVPTWTSPSTGEEEPDYTTAEYLTWLRQKLSGLDAVFHAGALVGTTRCAVHAARVWGSNVAGACNLADAVASYNSRARFFFFASEAEFDPADYSVAAPIRPGCTRINPLTRYGMSKLAGRLLVEKSFNTAELRGRLRVVYPCFGFGGSRDGTSCVAELLKCAAGIYQRRPFIPLRPDLVKEVTPHALIASIVADDFEIPGPAGPLIAASGWKLPYAEVVRAVEEVTGVSLDPEWRGDLDYKGELMYFGRRNFDAECLRSALSLEWEGVSSGTCQATHEWIGVEQLGAAAGAVRTELGPRQLACPACQTLVHKCSK